MSSGPVVAFELIGEGAIAKWRSLIGPTDSAAARSEAPASLRARFGAGIKTRKKEKPTSEDYIQKANSR